MNPKLNKFFDDGKRWGRECAALRKIVLSCGLDEEMKWGQPCYTHEGRNIVLIHGFKDYCALLFFKGALMKDAHKLLIQQTQNVQQGRQIRFASLSEITSQAKILRAYVEEAIAVERSGAKLQKRAAADYDVPEEFASALNQDASLKRAFEGLTPGRQRGYLLHFAGAKQSATRAARVAKCVELIKSGKGLND